MNDINLVKISEKDKRNAIELLHHNNLPVEDIGENVMLYGYYKNEKLMATIGFEAFDTEGLLRSVCVDEAYRNQHLGGEIVVNFEKILRGYGIQNLYLLTTTAQRFFEKNQYEVIARESVSDAIRASSEFSSVCPSSATIMRKVIL